MKQPLVYDIGMYDGSDTEYYLSQGYKVVAIEAHPGLIEKAKKKFAKEIDSGRLSLVPIGVAEKHGTFQLTICADDLGSSTLQASHLGSRDVAGTIDVPCAPINDFFDKYGTPWFMKVDIEGKDGVCVKGLTKSTRPEYLSCEIGSDFEEVMQHAQSIGYTKFKLIQQTTFMEIHQTWRDKLWKRSLKTFGFSDPCYAKINGKVFKTKHSAGPAPWESNGKWRSADALLKKYKRMKEAGQLFGWYDLHAS